MWTPTLWRQQPDRSLACSGPRWISLALMATRLFLKSHIWLPLARNAPNLRAPGLLHPAARVFANIFYSLTHEIKSDIVLIRVMTSFNISSEFVLFGRKWGVLQRASGGFGGTRSAQYRIIHKHVGFARSTDVCWRIFSARGGQPRNRLHGCWRGQRYLGPEWLVHVRSSRSASIFFLRIPYFQLIKKILS